MSTKKMKIYPVEIELTENFLEKNPTIKDMYEDGKLKVSISSNIDESIANTITAVVGDLKSKDLALFNPLLEAINEIAEFKTVVGTAKPVKEEGQDDKDYQKILKAWIKSDGESYKAITGTLRSFNGSATKSKSEIKAPILDAGRKIDTLYNALKDFSTNVKETADKNFKPLIDEVQRIKDEKEKAAKEQELQQIQDLENKNQEANEKLMQAQKKSNYADTMAEVSGYYIEQEQKIPTLNQSGLHQLREEVEAKKFDFSHIGPLEQATLESLQKSLKEGAVLKINSALSQDDVVAEKVEEQEFVESVSTESGDDTAIFTNMIFRLGNVESELSKITTNFTDERLKGTGEKLNIQFKTLLQNVGKLKEFSKKKAEIYNSAK